MSLLFLAVGVAVLYFGGELLVEHASGLGRRFGLSPLVVGLTIVAFGTSSPELATSMLAVFRGAPELAIGNVIGSNIANLGLVLALTALVHPIHVRSRFLYREGGFMLLTSASLLWLAADGRIGNGEGVILFVVLLGYLGVLLRRRGTPEVEKEFSDEFDRPAERVWLAVAGTVAGIALLVLGAELLVRGAVGVARQFGISERIIGLTMVAFGTSLPELATSVVAALKREGDIVVGNLIGSNIFNVLAVLGVTASIKPVMVDWATVRIDVWVMLAISAMVLVLLRTRLRLARIEAGVVLAAYLGYMVYLYRIA